LRILGIDPGLNTTGYGVLEISGRKPRLIEAGVVRSTPRGSMPERIREIYDGLTEVLDPLFALWKAQRAPGEGFGDFAHRHGIAQIKAVAVEALAPRFDWAK
jgi:sulfite reductase beta subunit-like hemoprotein